MALDEVTPIMDASFSTSDTQRDHYQSIGRSSREDRGSYEQQQEEHQQQISRKGDNNDSNNNPRNAINHDQQGSSSADNNNNNDQGNAEDRVVQQSWYRLIVEKYGTLELDNKGSVARDHLALERTFLAWLRTSLSFASIGIAVTQLFRLNSSISCGSGAASHQSNSDILSTDHASSSLRSPSSSSLLEILLAPPSDNIRSSSNNTFRNIGKPLGATFIAIAVLILIVGFHRYFESQYWIVRGKFPASRGSVALVSFVAAGLVIASFVVILVIAPTTMEL